MNRYPSHWHNPMLTVLVCSSLQCRCHPGFRLKDDGKTCVDVDECSTTYPCTQHCINTHGSFRCVCVDGFQLSPSDPTVCKSTSGTSPTANLSITVTDVLHCRMVKLDAWLGGRLWKYEKYTFQKNSALDLPFAMLINHYKRSIWILVTNSSLFK